MTVTITRVMPAYDYTVVPRRFTFANVVAKDDRGVSHLLYSRDAWLVSLCERWQGKTVDIKWEPVKKTILDLRELVSHEPAL